MYNISIDGACRGNGKPDCVSSGGVFVQNMEDPSETHTFGGIDHKSTNQRGELRALIIALEFIIDTKGDTARVITDSEYLYNSITKSWYDKWRHNGWKGSTGSIIKNQDMWDTIVGLIDKIDLCKMDMYHIKGHVIPFGAVGAKQLLTANTDGYLLQQAMYDKFDSVALGRSADKITHAEEVFVKNHQFELPRNLLRDFVVSNCVADSVAQFYLDKAIL